MGLPAQQINGNISPLEEQSDRPSLLLYLAGLIVTLCGLFAVNYTFNAGGSQLIYLLAIFGYSSSYVLRLRGVKTLSVGLLLLMIGLAVATFLNPSILPFVNQDRADDRIMGLLQIFVWASILHSYTLLTDSSLLFACVPCMTMLALVSARNPDPIIHQDFIIFVTASVFLMIHENYLRTTRARVFAPQQKPKSLFQAQLQLVFACLFTTLILADVVATPLRAVGQALFGMMFQQTPYSQHIFSAPNSSSSVQVKELNKVQVATGPVSGSDQPLLEITSPRPLYWRGAIFTYYTGNGFQAASYIDPDIQIFPQEQTDRQRIEAYEDITSPLQPPPTRHHFVLPSSDLDPPTKHSAEIKQVVQTLGGSFLQIYGAGRISQVDVPYNVLAYSPQSEKLTPPDPIAIQSQYTVVSEVPLQDPHLLRKASSSLQDIPPSIRQTCLQTAVNGKEDPALRQLALSITRGLSNNYDKACAIRAYIASHCKYNLHAPAVPRDQDVVDYFLFKTHQGYCDSFGAAMVMLCRYAGVPARLASGFITGEPHGNNTFLVREKDKHIWAEVFFPHIGWIPFDATEGATEVTGGHGLTNSLHDFLNWCLSRGFLPTATICVIVGLLLFVLWNEVGRRWKWRHRAKRIAPNRAPTNSQAIALYIEWCSEMAKKGLPRPTAFTPDEYAQWLQKQLGAGEWNALIYNITSTYTDARYSQRVLSAEEAGNMQKDIETLRALLRHWSPALSSKALATA